MACGSTTSELQLLVQQGKKKGGGRYFMSAMVVGYVPLCVCLCVVVSISEFKVQLNSGSS